MKFFNTIHRFSSSWTGTIIIVLFLIFFVVQSFVIPSGSMKRTLHEGDFLFAKKFAYGTPIPTLPWLEIPLLPDFNGNGHLFEGSKPQRGDIVIFRYPKERKVHYVKRCVATGGDEVIYVDKHLYIHFAEGDEYIQNNYPKKKIKPMMGKLWIDNPYKDKYPGIQYEPKDGNPPIFDILLQQEHLVDMSGINVQELGVSYSIHGKPMNALYRKIPKGEYYMMGDNRDNSNDSRFWGPVSYRDIVGKPWVIYMSIDWDTYQVRWNRVGRVIENLQYEEPTY